ncbi:MAG: BatD family protein, partial [Spirochaetales bacterium]|nr:BatD family protein [Spirochaetales bacterium]
MRIKTGKTNKLEQLILLICFVFITSSLYSQSNGVSLTAQLDNDEVWLGDSVKLILSLQGSDSAVQPDLSIPNVRVTPLGGTNRSSSSITNINGRVTKTVQKAYVYQYQLTPRIAGIIKIPSIELDVDNQHLKSNNLTLRVKIPETSEDFRLLLAFDRSKVFLSEECVLDITFEFEKSLKTLEFNIPGLDGYSFKSNPKKLSADKYQ